MKMKNKAHVHIVYKVTNLETGESYIGATTRSIEEQKADHIQKANKGTGGYFQEAMATYHPEDFSWEQIDTANSLNELAEKEKEYIKKYNSKEKGYNSDSGGGFKKRVFQYNKSGDIIAAYESLKEVETAQNFDKRRISKACTTSAPWKGFFWSYSENSVFSWDYDKRKKTVYQMSFDQEIIAAYMSVAEASRVTGLSKTCISRCCRGERKKSGGFIWKY